MLEKRKDISANAKKSSKIMVILYAVAKQLIYIFTYPRETWFPRAVAGLLMLISVFAITESDRLSNCAKSILAPFSFALIEIALCSVIGGDRMLYYFLVGCSLMSLLFLDTMGLFFEMILTFFCTAVISLLSETSLLGPNYTYIDDFHGLAALVLLNTLIFLLGKYSVGSFKISEKTGSAFGRVLETTPNHLILTNEKACVDYVSRSFAEAMDISDRHNTQGRPLLDLCSGELKMAFQEVMEAGGYVEKSFEITIGEKPYWYMLRSSLMGSNNAARVFELSDITPIMEAKNEAEAATRAKSSFLANMSHEIRTPMNAIVGLTELIMLKPLEKEQMNHAVAIKGASASLLNIINDILDFSKIDAEKMEIINKPFDFASFLNDTINIVNVKAETAAVTFTTHISKDIPPLINSDELRLKQVLINLLNNAIKFTKKGCVSLHVMCENAEPGKIKLTFSIKDTGIGIKKEDLNKLFGAFQQVDTHKNSNIEGTGLGLVISRRLIELMGGGISVESEYGKGSDFSFYVMCSDESAGRLVELSNPGEYSVICYEPNRYRAQALKESFDNLEVESYVCEKMQDFERLIKQRSFTHVFYDKEVSKIADEFSGNAVLTLMKDVGEMESISVSAINRPILITVLANILEDRGAREWGKDGRNSAATKLGSFKVEGGRVLLVDDNPVNLMVAEGMLREYGIEVVTASGGREGVEKSGAGTFDIIFMDHMMPDMDGIEATRLIRLKGGQFIKLPIIALTANAITGAEEMYLEAGMDGFLSKPIVIKKLNSILLSYLPIEKIIT